MPRRRGRPGLVGTMARTAVIAGTATAVSGSVQQSQASKRQAASAQQTQNEQFAQMQADQAAAQQAAAQQAAIDAAVAEAAPAAGTAAGGDTIAQLQQLAELKTAGILTDEEFEVQKAKILGA